MNKNAKCPKCNGEFVATRNTGTIACPLCGSEIDAVRARKYFSAFNGIAPVTGEAHGEKYFKYEEQLLVGSHYLEREEYENAREAYLHATEINPGDYRGYMGLVAAETKNYTDLKDTAHKPYLQRALAVANEEQQKQISSIYKIYDVKASMTEDEYEAYLTEKQKDYKARVKKAIIGLSKVNDAGKKKAKAAFIVMVSMLAAGAIMLVLGLVFSIAVLMIVGFLVAVSSYGASFSWMRQRHNVTVYEFLVSLFNAMKDFELDREQTDKLLALMSAVLLSVKEGDPNATIEREIGEIALFLRDTGSKNAVAFLKTQKFTAKHVGK